MLQVKHTANKYTVHYLPFTDAHKSKIEGEERIPTRVSVAENLKIRTIKMKNDPQYVII